MLHAGRGEVTTSVEITVAMVPWLGGEVACPTYALDHVDVCPGLDEQLEAFIVACHHMQGGGPMLNSDSTRRINPRAWGVERVRGGSERRVRARALVYGASTARVSAGEE